MKKTNFVEGTIISTIGLVICKIIGILYVIPFRAIIGLQGAILYSYAYTIYTVFLSISSSGIPNAVAKITSEYNTLGYYNAERRAYNISKKIITAIGFISFLILFIFAESISYLIIGNLEGGNTIEDITYVIRIISTALLVIPILSVSKGYLQGLTMMSPSAIANIIEQLARVALILIGTYLCVNVFNCEIKQTVAVAVFAATFGAIIAYIYIHKKVKLIKNPNIITKDQYQITDQTITKKIIKYSLPFIIIAFIRSLYDTIDTFTVVKTLVNLGYDITEAETILSVISTWGAKLNVIILSVTFGLTTSIIPNIVKSKTLKNNKGIENQINQALKIIYYTSLPMIIGIYFLKTSVWTIFYGYDEISVQVFGFFILQTLSMAFYYCLLDTSSALNKIKLALTVLIGSFTAKALLNIPIITLLHSLNLKAYYGSTVTTILIQTIASLILLKYIKKSYNIKYKKIGMPFIKITLINAIMLISLNIIRLVIGDFDPTLFNSILEIILYGIIGIVIYIYYSVKYNILNEVFTDEFVSKIKNKLKRA